MGKIEEQSLHRNQRQSGDEAQNRSSSSGLLCERCSMALARLAQHFSFRCVVVLLLSLAVLVYGIFSILPYRPHNSGFDAQQAIKLSASAQAYFSLEKPVSELLPHIAQLEYDINEEIGAPNMKVVVLSMHQLGAPNWTGVVFGALPDPINSQISQVSLSVMRSSLIEVFMQQSNLTLTKTIFGQPSKFEILKFQGGITVIPEPVSIWQIPQILFNFTLNNSISDIVENIVELEDQLKYGLRLRNYENVFVQITNKAGSTTDAPVVIQASVTSNFGNLPPQRLRQLAETLTGSPAQNLGLDNRVFGEVKSISLSSYLRGTLSSLPPSPSPAPAPEPSVFSGPSISPYPDPPAYSRAPAPTPDPSGPPPCSDCDASSPAPSFAFPESPPQPCPYHSSKLPPGPSPMSSSNPISPSASTPVTAPHSRPMGPKSQMSPDVAPVHALSPWESRGNRKGLVSSSFAPSPSSSAADALPKSKTLHSLLLSALIIFYLLCRSD